MTAYSGKTPIRPVAARKAADSRNRLPEGLDIDLFCRTMGLTRKGFAKVAPQSASGEDVRLSILMWQAFGETIWRAVTDEARGLAGKERLSLPEGMDIAVLQWVCDLRSEAVQARLDHPARASLALRVSIILWDMLGPDLFFKFMTESGFRKSAADVDRIREEEIALEERRRQRQARIEARVARALQPDEPEPEVEPEPSVEETLAPFVLATLMRHRKANVYQISLEAKEQGEKDDVTILRRVLKYLRAENLIVEDHGMWMPTPETV